MAISEIGALTEHQAGVRAEVRTLLRLGALMHQLTASRLGLSAVDVMCLGALMERGSLRPRELGAATGLSSGGVTFAIDRLERASFVTRHRDETDRRGLRVRLESTAYDRLSPLLGPVGRAVDVSLAARAESRHAANSSDPANSRHASDSRDAADPSGAEAARAVVTSRTDGATGETDALLDFLVSLNLALSSEAGAQ